MEREWRNELPALITDGRVVLGSIIQPAFRGHSIRVTGRCALTDRDGDVDTFNNGFLEVLYFVWLAEASDFDSASKAQATRICLCTGSGHAAEVLQSCHCKQWLALNCYLHGHAITLAVTDGILDCRGCPSARAPMLSLTVSATSLAVYCSHPAV